MKLKMDKQGSLGRFVEINSPLSLCQTLIFPQFGRQWGIQFLIFVSSPQARPKLHSLRIKAKAGVKGAGCLQQSHSWHKTPIMMCSAWRVIGWPKGSPSLQAASAVAPSDLNWGRVGAQGILFPFCLLALLLLIQSAPLDAHAL